MNLQTTSEPMFRVGVVEANDDPLELGRVKVRVTGVHTDSLSELPTSDLPWAEVLNSVYSASISGKGDTPRMLNGSWVLVSFFDPAKQKPMVWGTIAGIPGNIDQPPTKIGTVQEQLNNTPPAIPPQPVVVTSPTGKQSIVEPGYIGSLTNSQVVQLKSAIAQSETGGTSNPYAVENSIGFIGKYQFGAAYLKDQGYINKSAQGLNKTIIDNPSSWTGKSNINSKNDFFNRPDIQEGLMDAMLKNNYRIMANAGVLSPNVVPEKTAGLLMAAHLKGAGGAIKFANGQDSTDAYGTSTSSYYNKGYAAIAGKGTVEAPSLDNLTKPAIDKNIPVRDDARKYDPGIIVDTNQQKGFKDPSGKYPLPDHLNEPDTNRLARGSNISATIVGEKEANLTTNVPVANSSATWNQSPVPYATVYPYNRVYESEAGHIMEFDDTPGAERINIHHASGTFNETDHLGNQTEKTIGTRTIIVEKDELIYIVGNGHVSLGGDLSIRVNGACNIEVAGNTSIHSHGSVFHRVDGDYNLNVGGSFNLGAGSMISQKAGGTFAIDGASLALESGASVTPSSMPGYSPVIQIPAPVSRHDKADFKLEGETDITSVIYSQEQPTTSQTDTTPTSNNIQAVKGICGFTSLSNSTVLSANYTLSDLCKDGPFPLQDGQHNLSPEELACNLKQLSVNVIEPLRAYYASVGFKINSCFRPAGSSISKSKSISQHELGQAVDIGFSHIRGQSNDKAQYYNIAQQIKNMVPFDQMLMEYRSNGNVWIHISFSLTANRSQILTLFNDKVYSQGLVLIN